MTQLSESNVFITTLPYLFTGKESERDWENIPSEIKYQLGM